MQTFLLKLMHYTLYSCFQEEKDIISLKLTMSGHSNPFQAIQMLKTNSEPIIVQVNFMHIIHLQMTRAMHPYMFQSKEMQSQDEYRWFVTKSSIHPT